MMNRLVSLVGAAAVLLAGRVARAQSSPVVLAFNADWSISQSGPLVPGQTAVVQYDVNRLPSCRATYNGLPAWAITAGLQADASSNVDTLVVTTGSYASNPIDVSFTVPYGETLSVWFHNSDEAGCNTWDSNYGQNFQFAIEGPPTIHYDVNWTDSVAGTLRQGQSFAIDYDIRRLSSCRATYNGYDAWDVTVFYRFDGGAISTASLTQVVDTYHKAAAPAVLSAPAGAQQAEMWFQTNDYTGCVAWDSDYGQNYSFSLQ